MRWQDYFDCKFPESSCLNGSESDLFKQGAWLAVKHINGTPGGGYPGARLDDTDSGILIEEKRRGYASALQKALNHVKAAQAWRDQLPAGRTVADLKAAGFKDAIYPGQVEVFLVAEVGVDRLEALQDELSNHFEDKNPSEGKAHVAIGAGIQNDSANIIYGIKVNGSSERSQLTGSLSISSLEGCTLLTQTMEALQEGDAEARREHPRP